jgi:hypothetical protein
MRWNGESSALDANDKGTRFGGIGRVFDEENDIYVTSRKAEPIVLGNDMTMIKNSLTERRECAVVG